MSEFKYMPTIEFAADIRSVLNLIAKDMLERDTPEKIQIACHQKNIHLMDKVIKEIKDQRVIARAQWTIKNLQDQIDALVLADPIPVIRAKSYKVHA